MKNSRTFTFFVMSMCCACITSCMATKSTSTKDNLLSKISTEKPQSAKKSTKQTIKQKKEQTPQKILLQKISDQEKKLRKKYKIDQLQSELLSKFPKAMGIGDTQYSSFENHNKYYMENMILPTLSTGRLTYYLEGDFDCDNKTDKAFLIKKKFDGDLYVKFYGQSIKKFSNLGGNEIVPFSVASKNHNLTKEEILKSSNLRKGSLDCDTFTVDVWEKTSNFLYFDKTKNKFLEIHLDD